MTKKNLLHCLVLLAVLIFAVSCGGPEGDTPKHEHQYELQADGSLSCPCGNSTISEPYIAFVNGKTVLSYSLISSGSSSEFGLTVSGSDISYTNTSGKKSVAIFTSNKQNLTINAPLDDVKHFGSSKNVNIVAVASSSYVGNAKIAGDLVIKQGHIEINTQVSGEVKVEATGAVALDCNADLSKVSFKLDSQISSEESENIEIKVNLTSNTSIEKLSVSEELANDEDFTLVIKVEGEKDYLDVIDEVVVENDRGEVVSETDFITEKIADHVHEFKEIVSSEYLKSSATCTEPAIYYKSCSKCKTTNTDTFENGKALGHVTGTDLFSDGSTFWNECSYCGEKFYFEPDCYYNLSFELSANSGIFYDWLLVYDTSRVVVGERYSTQSEYFPGATGTSSKLVYPLTIIGNDELEIKAYLVPYGTTNTDNATRSGSFIYKGGTLTENHNWIKLNEKAATCTTDGFIRYRCQLCNTTTQTSIPKLGHNETIEYTWTSDSDNYYCTANWTCSRCTEEKSETITATVINYKAPTRTEDGYSEYVVTFTDTAFNAQSLTVEHERLWETGDLVSYEIIGTTKPVVKFTFLWKEQTWNIKEEAQKFLNDPKNYSINIVGLDINVSEILNSVYEVIYSSDTDNCYEEIKPILDDIVDNIGNDVTVITYKYKTKDLEGNMTEASALAFFPQSSDGYSSVPIYSCQRTAITKKSNSPTVLASLFPDGYWNVNSLLKYKDMDVSLNLIECAGYYCLAQTGYITIIADGLGFGDNDDVAAFGLSASGRVFADSIYACEELSSKLSSQQSSHNGKVYLAGYSEGAYITMATARQMIADGNEPDAIACGDGCYSISDVTLKTILDADETYPSPYYLPMMFKSLDAAYGDEYPIFSIENSIRNDISGINLPQVLYDSCDGNHDTTEIDDIVKNSLGALYTGPKSILSQAFIDGLGTSPIKDVFEEQDSYVGFIPQKCKVLLLHNINDEKLPVENSYIAAEYFTDNGVGTNLLETDYFTGIIKIQDSVHINSAIPALLKAYKWISEQN